MATIDKPAGAEYNSTLEAELFKRIAGRDVEERPPEPRAVTVAEVLMSRIERLEHQLKAHRQNPNAHDI